MVFNPVVYVLLTLGVGLYFRAVRVLARRGYTVPYNQQLAWYSGIFLTSIGLVSPIGAAADSLLCAHMAEHLLIADLAAPLLLVGMRTPVYAFLLPKPVLVPLARLTPLRRAFRLLRQPLVALPLFALVLYGWHFSFAFEAAVRHSGIHALQHASFVGVAMLVWWSALEPKRRHMPGELWKIGHIFAARMISMFLGVAFVFMRHPVYTSVYGSGKRHGISAITDQQYAGGMMMTLDILIMFFALTLFFWRTASDHTRAEELEAAGRSAAVSAGR